MSVYKYYAPRTTLFGYGCIEEGLANEIKSYDLNYALIVTDKPLIELGIVKIVTDALDKGDIKYDIFDGVQPNPTLKNVNDGLSMLNEKGCDFVLSIGGGSAHDCAKAIALLKTNDGNIVDFAKAAHSTKNLAMPQVAVNTTAGTGSECTQAYVIIDESTGIKYGIKDKNTICTIAVDDHKLMMGLPKGLTAGTGMDALTHAIETYTSKNSFKMTAALAESAIKLCFDALPDATLKSTEQSREDMAVAQYIAGLAFANSGCGLVHSMSHQLSAVYDLPHGLCNAIILPAVMKFNCADKMAEMRFANLGKIVCPIETANLDDAAAAKYFISEVEKLSETVGTKVALKSIGVKEEDLSLLADKTLVDGSIGNNPVMPTKEEIIALFKGLM